MNALVIGGTGPTGPFVVHGLLKRGYDVSLFHRGIHELPDLDLVEHIHGDPFVQEGIEAALLSEWQRSLPDLPARSEKAASGNARKAWRFVGEMEEIAATFADAGLPTGFSLAAREIYQRLEQYKDAPATPSVADAASAILGS